MQDITSHACTPAADVGGSVDPVLVRPHTGTCAHSAWFGTERAMTMELSTLGKTGRGTGHDLASGAHTRSGKQGGGLPSAPVSGASVPRGWLVVSPDTLRDTLLSSPDFAVFQTLRQGAPSYCLKVQLKCVRGYLGRQRSVSSVLCSQHVPREGSGITVLGTAVGDPGVTEGGLARPLGVAGTAEFPCPDSGPLENSGSLSKTPPQAPRSLQGACAWRWRGAAA